jgi:hypothetical protein
MIRLVVLALALAAATASAQTPTLTCETRGDTRRCFDHHGYESTEERSGDYVRQPRPGVDDVAAGERRAPRAAEAAIGNPLFDDASLKGARGVLISITGGEDLTLYEVDEAASRIRQEVDEEANIIVGAIIEPTLQQALRVSVVATGIDQTTNGRMNAQSFAEPVSPPNVAPPSLDQTVRTLFSTVESHPPIVAGRELKTPPLPSPVIPFPEPTARPRSLDEETHLNPPAIRRLLDRFAVAASETRQARRASA